MTVTVRRLPAPDVEAQAQGLLSLLDGALQDSPVSTNRITDLEYMRGRMEHAGIQQGQRVVVAEVDDLPFPVGFAVGVQGVPCPVRYSEHLRSLSPDQRLFVLWIAVATGQRRRGIATALHDALLNDPEIRRAWLLVDDANLPAQRLYQRLGWQQTAQQGPRHVSEVAISGA